MQLLRNVCLVIVEVVVQSFLSEVLVCLGKRAGEVGVEGEARPE